MLFSFQCMGDDRAWDGEQVAFRRLVLVCIVVSSACAMATTAPAGRATAVHESVITTVLHNKPLELHLAAPTSPLRNDLLIIYASGDGGWFGSAVSQWRQFARAGVATVGFSSRAFLRIERPPGAALDAPRLATEYQQIVRDAKRAMGLPDAAQVVLTGWSRGAAFAVLVGSESAFGNTLAGVIAIGLADGEDLAISDDDDDDDGSASTAGRRWRFDTYARLAELTVPCAVIQATHDNYFPAANARQRFGPDTPTRHFYAVEAKNHRFSGGTDVFNASVLDALHWLAPVAAH